MLQQVHWRHREDTWTWSEKNIHRIFFNLFCEYQKKKRRWEAKQWRISLNLWNWRNRSRYSKPWAFASGTWSDLAFSSPHMEFYWTSSRSGWRWPCGCFADCLTWWAPCATPSWAQPSRVRAASTRTYCAASGASRRSSVSGQRTSWCSLSWQRRARLSSPRTCWRRFFPTVHRLKTPWKWLPSSLCVSTQSLANFHFSFWKGDSLTICATCNVVRQVTSENKNKNKTKKVTQLQMLIKSKKSKTPSESSPFAYLSQEGSQKKLVCHLNFCGEHWRQTVPVWCGYVQKKKKKKKKKTARTPFFHKQEPCMSGDSRKQETTSLAQRHKTLSFVRISVCI